MGKVLERPSTLDLPVKRVKTQGTVFYFKGMRDVFSNYYPSKIMYNGKMFGCVEQAYQYCKAIESESYDTARTIMTIDHGYVIATLASKIRCKKHWLNTRVDVMRSILEAKAMQCDEYRDKLLSTSGIIAESSVHDLFWSTGIAPEDFINKPDVQWPGANVMGALHAQVRDGQQTSGDGSPEPEDGEIQSFNQSSPEERGL